jgi:hypothetical protein
VFLGALKIVNPDTIEPDPDHRGAFSYLIHIHTIWPKGREAIQMKPTLSWEPDADPSTVTPRTQQRHARDKEPERG